MEVLVATGCARGGHVPEEGTFQVPLTEINPRCEAQMSAAIRRSPLILALDEQALAADRLAARGMGRHPTVANRLAGVGAELKVGFHNQAGTAVQ